MHNNDKFIPKSCNIILIQHLFLRRVTCKMCFLVKMNIYKGMIIRQNFCLRKDIWGMGFQLIGMKKMERRASSRRKWSIWESQQLLSTKNANSTVRKPDTSSKLSLWIDNQMCPFSANDPVHQPQGHLWTVLEEGRRLPSPQCRSHLCKVHQHVSLQIG